MSESKPKRRGNPNMRKGMPSINPKGRPRSGLAFAERVRERVDPDKIIDAVLEVLENAEKPSERLQAATFLRDSAYAKPPTATAIQLTTGNEEQSQYNFGAMPLEKRIAILDAIRAAKLIDSEESK